MTSANMYNDREGKIFQMKKLGFGIFIRHVYLSRKECHVNSVEMVKA